MALARAGVRGDVISAMAGHLLVLVVVAAEQLDVIYVQVAATILLLGGNK